MGILILLSLAVSALSAMGVEFVSGYYVSASGIQFEQDCFENRSIQRPARLAALEGALSEAVQKIRTCEQRFPELAEYTQRWLQEFTETKVKCGTLKGINASRYIKLRLNRRVFERLLISAESLAQSAQMREARSQAIGTLIHETFHAAGGDNVNTFAHNRRRKRYSEVPRLVEGVESCTRTRELCSESDITQDRVSVLTSLCARTPLKETGLVSASRHLQYKSLHCGFEAACESLFTQGNRPFVKTINLSETRARTLCLRIFEEGSCLVRNPEFPEYGTGNRSCGVPQSGQNAQAEWSRFRTRCGMSLNHSSP